MNSTQQQEPSVTDAVSRSMARWSEGFVSTATSPAAPTRDSSGFVDFGAAAPVGRTVPGEPGVTLHGRLESDESTAARTSAAPADRIRFDCQTVYPVAQLSSAGPAIRLQPTTPERKARSVGVHASRLVVSKI